MQKFIACLLVVAMLGIIPSLLSAQQNQSVQKSDPQIEVLKKRVSELEKQLQTVENVEKLDLQAKLAEANAKLANAEFGKFERELRDSNREWLRNWVLILLAFLSVVGIGIWSWLKSRTNELIETEVEKNLNGFKEAVDQVEGMKDELGELKREHAASVLKSLRYFNIEEKHSYPERVETLSEEVLLQVFGDERYGRRVRSKAMEILAHRKSPRFVSQSLDFINSTVDRENEQLKTHAIHPHIYIRNLARAHTQEAHHGVSKFLNRLLTENPVHTDSVLTLTTLALSDISVELSVGDSVSILRRAIPHLKVEHTGREVIENLAICFDKFHEPDGIKEILINHIPGEMHRWESVEGSVENRCLGLLQKHDPEFVEGWRAKRTTDNNET